MQAEQLATQYLIDNFSDKEVSPEITKAVIAAFIAGQETAFKWVSVYERLPNKKEQVENWKFLVSNSKDEWTDSAYFEKDAVWHNGECEIYPTHWMPLPAYAINAKEVEGGK